MSDTAPVDNEWIRVVLEQAQRNLEAQRRQRRVQSEEQRERKAE